MTKTTLLTAASVVAVLFAGAANAHEISGTIGAAGSFDKDDAYVAASELIVSATAKATGAFTATNTLKTPIKLTDGISRDYLVTFEVAGATVDAANLALDAAYDNTKGSVGSSLVSSENGVVTFLVTAKANVGAANTLTVDSFTLETSLSQSAQATVTVGGKVVALIGGSQIPVDTAPAVTAAVYSPLFTTIKATATSITAALPSYKLFAGDVLTAALAPVKSVNTGDFHDGLSGNVVTAGDLLVDGGLVTITGPLITQNLTASVPGTAVETDLANTAVFSLTAAQAAAFVTGTPASAGKLQQTATVADQETILPGSYTISWAPKLDSDFRAPAASSATVGNVALAGTNFVAPWISGTGLATSVIRVSNSNARASGTVTVRLLNAVTVANGVSTPFTTTAAPLVVGTVPGSGDLQITSAQLVAHFGAFTRGDFRITVNSASSGFNAKVRNTRDGVSFEQSLGN